MREKLIITNNLSVDSSGDLIHKLIAEGLPITLEEDNRHGFLQNERMQKMMRRAFSEFKADWVLLLDADEILVPPTGKTLRETFAALKDDRLLKVPWITYVPTESDSDEPNILKRITHRLENEVTQLNKVMVPATIGRKQKAVIKMGNHNMAMRGKLIKKQDAPLGMYLAHFPVRSKEQVATKALVGWISLLARPNYRHGDCYHWKSLCEQFLDDKEGAFNDLQDVAINYAGKSENKNELPNVISDPIEDGLSDFVIKYPQGSKNDPLKVFVKTAEEIALNHGRLDTRVKALASSPLAAFLNFLTVLSKSLLGRK